MKYIKSLDGVRGLAILLVFFFHYLTPFEFGWVGVQLFFVLSGYLITSILLKDKQRKLGDYLKTFYWRRTLRIFPIYYAYLILITIVYFVGHSPSDFPSRAPFLFSYTYNFYALFSHFENDTYFLHFWSLSIEEQFYLFWPLIIYFCSGRQLKGVLIALILGAPVFRYFFGIYLASNHVVSPELIGQVVYRITPSQLDAFAFGAAIPAFRLHERVRSGVGLFAGMLTVLFALGGLNLWSYWHHGSEIPFSSLGYPIGGMLNLQHVWSYSLISLTSMALVVLCIRQSGYVTRLAFENPVMVFLGKFSYGLYIYHWVISMVFRVYLQDKVIEPLGFVVYALVCLGVAVVSYYVLERPFLLLKDRFYKKKEPTIQGGAPGMNGHEKTSEVLTNYNQS